MCPSMPSTPLQSSLSQETPPPLTQLLKSKHRLSLAQMKPSTQKAEARGSLTVSSWIGLGFIARPCLTIKQRQNRNLPLPLPLPPLQQALSVLFPNCPCLLSVAMLNTMTSSYLGRKGFIASNYSQVTIHHQQMSGQEVKAGTRRPKLKHKRQRTRLTGLLPMTS